MSKQLILEEITPQGPKEVGRLSGGQVIVGREPGDGIAIPKTAISRSHGMFLRLRNHWFYKDLGSTNGSWRNGKPIKEGQMRLVRAGDVLQLADTPIRLRSDDGTLGAGIPQFSSSTLIVFSGQEFSDEFPLPEYGRALVVGGAQGDLPLGQAENDLPRLVIERRGEKVCAYGIAEGIPILLNGSEISEAVDLSDGDELTIANYTILFNDPRIASEGRQAQVGSVPGATAPGATVAASTGPLVHGTHPPGGALTSVLKDWTAGTGSEIHNPVREDPLASRTPSGKYLFGRGAPVEEDVEGTVAIDPAEVEARLAAYDPRATRYTGGDARGGSLLQSVEDKVIVLIGFLLLLGLIVTIAAWLLL